MKSSLAKISISRQAELCAQLSVALLSYINMRSLRKAIESKMSLMPLYRSMQAPDWATVLDYVKYLGAEVFRLSAEQTLSDSEHTVNKICTYINDHLSDDLGISRLAEVFNYNQSYISRLFKQVKSENLSQYIKNARLDRAKSLLKSTELPIQDIAVQVGFDTAQYFSMVFRREVGVTPKAYRTSI